MTPMMALVNGLPQVLEVLERSGMRNARIFAMADVGELRAGGDLHLLVDAPGLSLLDLGDAELELQQLLHCRVELVTLYLLAPEARRKAEASAVPLMQLLQPP